MNVQTAILLAEYELEKYPILKGWKVVLDRAKTRYGQCNYRRKIISLSTHFVQNNDPDRVRITIVHEIAHALCPGQKHNHIWKAKARELGIPDTRCSDRTVETVKSMGKYIAVCPSCARVCSRHKCPKGKYYCRFCGREKGQLTFMTNE